MSCGRRGDVGHHNHMCQNCSNTLGTECMGVCHDDNKCYWNEELPKPRLSYIPKPGDKVEEEDRVTGSIEPDVKEEEFYIHTAPGMYKTYNGPKFGWSRKGRTECE